MISFFQKLCSTFFCSFATKNLKSPFPFSKPQVLLAQNKVFPAFSRLSFQKAPQLSCRAKVLSAQSAILPVYSSAPVLKALQTNCRAKALQTPLSVFPAFPSLSFQKAPQLNCRAKVLSAQSAILPVYSSAPVLKALQLNCRAKVLQTPLSVFPVFSSTFFTKAPLIKSAIKVLLSFLRTFFEKDQSVPQNEKATCVLVTDTFSKDKGARNLPPSPPTHFLEIQGLTKAFKSGDGVLQVLDGVSLSLDLSQIAVITGKSGSGKSTLLNILGTLDGFTGGEIFVDGKALSSFTKRQKELYRLLEVGFVFQSHYLLKDFTALENVALPAMVRGLSKSKAFERAESLLDEVGLSQRLSHLPQELSGGECQRVAVARALVNDPRLILADEATGNLDGQNSKLVSDLLFRLARVHKKTLLFVTHDESLAQRADRHYNLSEGKLLLCK